MNLEVILKIYYFDKIPALINHAKNIPNHDYNSNSHRRSSVKYLSH